MEGDEVTFAALVEKGILKFGDGYRTKSDELGTTGYPILRVVNVTEGRIRKSGSTECVRAEFKSKIGSKISQAHDIVLTTKGTFGRRAIVTPDAADWVYSPQVCYFRIVDENKLEPGYLFAWLGSRQFADQALGRAAQTDMAAYLSLADLSSIRIEIPPIAEQRRIAKILGDLDDKIELNRKMNETLESMARALFKSWFVNFDPVRAKMEGRQPVGMDAETAALWPDKLVESEMGMIPEGWEVGTIESALVLQRGFDLPAEARVSGTHPVLAASGPSGTHHKFMVSGPGVTTGRSGVLGKVFYVAKDFWPLNTSLWVKEFRHSRPAYAFHLLQCQDFAQLNAGSAVPTLNRNHIHTLPTLLPPMRLIETFERFATECLAHQKNNDELSTSLAGARDTLLTKLILGEISVGNGTHVAMDKAE